MVKECVCGRGIGGGDGRVMCEEEGDLLSLLEWRMRGEVGTMDPKRGYIYEWREAKRMLQEFGKKGRRGRCSGEVNRDGGDEVGVKRERGDEVGEEERWMKSMLGKDEEMISAGAPC